MKVTREAVLAEAKKTADQDGFVIADIIDAFDDEPQTGNFVREELRSLARSGLLTREGPRTRPRWFLV